MLPLGSTSMVVVGTSPPSSSSKARPNLGPRGTRRDRGNDNDNDNDHDGWFSNVNPRFSRIHDNGDEWPSENVFPTAKQTPGDGCTAIVSRADEPDDDAGEMSILDGGRTVFRFAGKNGHRP